MRHAIAQSLLQFAQPAFVFNFAGIAIVAVCGVLLHVVVGAVWGSAALGVFNQVVGVYLLASQFACAGQQNAALRFTAADPTSAPQIATASLVICAAVALVVTAVFWLSRSFIGWLFESDATAYGMAWAAPGLFLFALNKVILAVLNGLNRMIWYSALQSIRFIMIVGLIVAAALLNLNSDELPLALTGAELVVFLISASVFAPSWIVRLQTRRLMHDLFMFGVKSLPATSLSEINMRVDVLILAIFATDSVVGIYSLASTIVEGFVQALQVLRALFAPTLVTSLELDTPSEKTRVVIKTRNFSYAAAALATAVALIIYPIFLRVSGLDRYFSGSFQIFAVLQIGTMLASGYIVLGTILMLGNRPGDQSLYVFIAVAMNISANLVLAACFGALGAAFATAGSNLLAAILLHWMMRRRLSLQI